MEKMNLTRALGFIFVGTALFSCVSQKTVSTDVGKKQNSSASVTNGGAETSVMKAEVPPTADSNAVVAPPVVMSDSGVEKPAPVRMGLIFSGGGAKAWAHIGVLKEIENAKWPIYAVGGQEWGAVVAATFANKLSANEVEWELSKVKALDDLDQISERIFDKRSVSELKVPFVCSSLNINKQTLFFLNRGQLSKLIPFCLAHPPLAKPYQQSVADLTDIAGLAAHLRATGANKIVLINVLAQSTKRSFVSDYLSADNILWAQSAAILAKKNTGVDETIHIKLDDYGIVNIDSRREIIAKGVELGYKQVKATSKKFGL